MKSTVSIDIPKKFKIACKVFDISVDELLQCFVNDLSIAHFLCVRDERSTLLNYLISCTKRKNHAKNKSRNYSLLRQMHAQFKLLENVSLEEKERAYNLVLKKWYKTVREDEMLKSY